MDDNPIDPNQLQLEFYDTYACWPTVNGIVQLMDKGAVCHNEALTTVDVGEHITLHTPMASVSAEWTKQGWRYHRL